MGRSKLRAAGALGLILGCAGVDEVGLEAELDRVVELRVEKQVYFGDLHIHSAWSLDAWSFGVRTTPEDSYRYARGEAIPHASGTPIQLQGPPLDFVALTEHANYMGVTR